MKRIQLLILSFILLFNFTSCKNQKVNVTPEDLCYDIQRIQLDLAYSSMKELYDPEPFEQLKKDVMSGKANRVDCILRIQDIISDFNIVHLNLYPIPTDKKDYLVSPILFRCFGNDYHVYFTLPKYKKFLGWKVKEIGGFSTEEAREKLLTYLPYETPTGAKYLPESAMTYYLLKYSGLLKHNRISFTLESPEGTSKKISCALVHGKKNKFVYNTPKVNPYSPYFSTNVYTMKPCPEKKTIYVPYTQCQGIAGYPVPDFINDLMKELENGDYDTIVFDIRLNGGGEQPVTYLFRHALYDHKEELEKYNLAVITGGRTYSAACWFLNNFLDVFPNARIFGEETGEAIFNYTMVTPYKLNKLNCDFRFPQIIDDLPVLKARSSDIYRGTMPDVEVQESFEDFMKGEDSIYNAIYEYFSAKS